ncbi:hypothetical protein C8A01DRAFT_15601 [Parachaetomium inaequale]|uniref:Uncharacterized protein n=1 Tax=Parachaetomium inaequale TaxID=2588326 RepID=A0AAN6PK44_9PEZI|nr:hypothetical protein C8A01DRAFT_15601 [Parachaetomium inaequale]
MEGEAARKEPKGKGKAVAASPDDAPGGGTAETTASGASLSRMAQSAASLLLSGPPRGGHGAGDEKGNSSQASEALARAGESSVQLRSNAARGETMKMGQTQEHIAQEEASFAAFLDSGSAPMLSDPSGMEDAWRSVVPGAATPRATGAMEPASRSIEEQEARDGADVAALLSSGGDLDQVFDHTDEPPAPNDLEALRKALFGEGADHGTSASISWDNVLNFIPEYLQAPTAPGIGLGDQLSSHLGTSDTGEAWQTWIGQWSHVLTSYQDEVWGDLGALVDESRAEIQRIEEAKPGEAPPKPTALLRLRAILGHLRGPY